MYKFFYILLLIVLFTSCDYFKTNSSQVPVARVNKSYLYQEDIKALISENTSKEDSALIVNSYINRWATQQLLLDQAKINLSEEQQRTYERLIQEYKNGLYTEAYKNKIVSRQLDTTVSQIELESYYELNKENFKLNDELLKIRYIHMPTDYNEVAVTKQKFNRFNEEDQKDLEAQTFKFTSYNFNDSIWVKKENLLKVMPVLSTKKEVLLNKSNNLQLQDSLGLYLLAVEDVLKTNDIAPLPFVKPTVQQIILNKRKLELVKKLEKDITKDAIKNNTFEIY
ncbi:peptidyl-prolyl cis-trans isomerase [Jejudonia soesokkakensis]|uniref:Peptidyl-prolyl cis-trans isomerase n=1 Tax=Jejudonia soesokkakensis TaxID=1323432 RepID=A0ABW2MQ11_9FLAO